MAIRSISVGPLRGIVHAEATNLGNLVVLAGANGAGKSTLLELIRIHRASLAEPGTKVMFIGPHRTWRSSALNKVGLYGFTLASYGALLESDNLPTYQFLVPQGMQGLQGSRRDSSSAEDAPAFVKTTLAKLRDRQQGLVTNTWENNHGTVGAGEVPNLFQPFERLVKTLLPHLDWVGVDDADQENIRVNFRPAGQDSPVFDIDQLSSGEKAAIALLLPLVERQADELVAAARPDPGLVPLTMLLDEPEIHLHPLLQLQVLQYLRELAAAGEAQFILSTQSPTLLDALNDDELYLVSPAELSPENQLTRLTTTHERLEVARDLTGSTHMLTRSKPIVFLEGESERRGVNSDARLVTNLLPLTKSWALVPGRSKSEVGSAVIKLRSDGIELPGTPVFGLVDSDSDSVSVDEHVIPWPVAMVENFLLDADAILETLEPFGTQTRAASLEIVRDSLRRAAGSLASDEIRIRVQRQLPVGRLALKPSEIGQAEETANSLVIEWLAKIESLDVASLTRSATDEVNLIVSQGAELERFHGKRLLQLVYQDLAVAQAGLSQPAFALSISGTQSARDRASRLGSASLQKIALFFPHGLVDALRAGGDQSAAEPLVARCDEELGLWSANTPRADNRRELRSELFVFARGQEPLERGTLLRLAAQIGTP